MFGNRSGNNANSFGSSGLFGNRQNNNSGFGQNNNSGFGQNNNSGFGQNNNAGFGQNNNAGFGQNNNAGFGQNNNAGFGQNKGFGGGGFGQSNTSGFGQSNTSGFGQNNNSGFGQNNASGFGQNNTSGFGQNNMSSFGKPNNDIAQFNPNKDFDCFFQGQNVSSEIQGNLDTFSDVAWSPTHPNILAASSWNKGVFIFEIGPPSSGTGFGGSSGAPTGTLRGAYQHDGPALCVTIEASNNRIISGGADKCLRVYDAQSNKSAIFGTHAAPVSCVVSACQMNNMIISASWDKTMKFWTQDALNNALSSGNTNPNNAGQAAATLNLPERAYSMAINYPVLIVGCAERQIAIYNLETITSNPNPVQVVQSKLNLQTRVVSIYHDKQGYAVGSIEGRVSLVHLDPQLSKDDFNFKCHRINNDVYAVNDIDFHPTLPQTMVTCGSNGTISIWDKQIKQKILDFQEFKKTPVNRAKFNCNGEYLAYSVGYDWSKGFSGVNASNGVAKLFVHKLVETEVKHRQNRNTTNTGGFGFGRR